MLFILDREPTVVPRVLERALRFDDLIDELIKLDVQIVITSRPKVILPDAVALLLS